MNAIEEMRKKIIKNKKGGVSIDSIPSSEIKKGNVSPVLERNSKSVDINMENKAESKEIDEKVNQQSEDKKDGEKQIPEKQQNSHNESSNQREDKKVFPIDPLFPNKSTNQLVIQRDTAKRIENESSNADVLKKVVSIENNEEVSKKSAEDKKTIRVVLK